MRGDPNTFSRRPLKAAVAVLVHSNWTMKLWQVTRAMTKIAEQNAEDEREAPLAG